MRRRLAFLAGLVLSNLKYLTGLAVCVTLVSEAAYSQNLTWTNFTSGRMEVLNRDDTRDEIASPATTVTSVRVGLRTSPGTLKWKFETEDVVYSSPAIGPGGTVYVGSLDNYLYAINPDGTLKWKFKTGAWVYSSPAVGPDGTVYVGSVDHYLYALNPDGTLRWKFKTGGWVSSSPAIGPDGTLYVGSCDRYLYAVSPDGTLRWKFETGGEVWSSPAIGPDGTVYVGSRDNYLYAVNPDGTLEWKFETGGWVDDSSPVIGQEGTVYVGSEDNHLYAVNPDGTLKWKFETGNSVDSSPAIGSDGTVYVGSADGYLYALNPDGTLKWKFETWRGVDSSPAIGSDGTVYVGSDNFYLYALNPDGTLKWKFETGWPVVSSPVIGPDGTVYVGSKDGYLYAIYTDSRGLADSPWPMFGHDARHTGRAGIPTPQPNIWVSATGHNFGSVTVGSHSDWSFYVHNVGRAVLTVNSATSDEPVFKVLSPKFPKDIPSGDSLEVTVRFLPTKAKSYSGTLTIFSNDPDEPEVHVSLEGCGSLPLVIEVSVLQNPALTRYLDLYVNSLAPLSSVPTITISTEGGEPDSVVLTEIAPQTYKGDYELARSGTSTISVHAVGATGRDTTVTRTFQARLLKPAGGSISTPDGMATLFVPPGALHRKTWFTAIPLQQVAQRGQAKPVVSSDTTPIGQAYRFGPPGVSFDLPLTLTFTYTEGELQGLDERKLRVYRYEKGQWKPLESLINPERNIVPVEVKTLGIYQLRWDPEYEGARLLPLSFVLRQNYPNPFNAETTIRYELPERTLVSLKIYNTQGQVVRTLVDQEIPAGSHTVRWDGRDETGRRVASGVYFYQMIAGRNCLTKKLLLLK